MVSWLKSAAAATAALLVLAVPAAAQVPDPFARELAQRLSQAEALLSERGYARAAGPFAGGLGERQGRRYPMTLRAGQDYRIVGVCESRCGDFDLRLLAPNGALVAQDVLEDNVPIIHVRPRITGSSPCWYAFNVYSR